MSALPHVLSLDGADSRRALAAGFSADDILALAYDSLVTAERAVVKASRYASEAGTLPPCAAAKATSIRVRAHTLLASLSDFHPEDAESRALGFLQAAE